MRGPIELIQASWNLFQENWKLFLGIFIVPGLVGTLFDYLTASDYKAEMFMREYPLPFAALLVTFLVLLIFMNIAMYKAVSAPKETTVQSAYRFAKKYFLQYVLLSIMVGIVVTLGFVALIIPGIILAVWFGFAYAVLIFEDKTGIDAMKASKAYVKGRWFEIFIRVIALIVFMILLSIATGIVGYVLARLLPGDIAVTLTSLLTSAIAMPIAIAYTYFMYVDVKKLGNVPAAEKDGVKESSDNNETGTSSM